MYQAAQNKCRAFANAWSLAVILSDMQFLENIPQPLYKYRVWEEPCKEKQFSRRLLTDNEVYLASADQFNDPFDGTLPFKYPKKELTPENIFLKLHPLHSA